MKKGFTLLELIIVVIILGVLVGISLPIYQKTVEVARAKEAITSLRLIYAAERIYRVEVDSYYPSSGLEPDITDINNNLRLQLNENIWDYNITGGTTTFTASADRITGPYSSCVYSINQNNTFSSTGTCAESPP